MTHPRFLLLAAGLLGLAAPLAAQNTPHPVVSTRPNEPAKGPVQATTNIVLRPNADLSFYVYLENPGQQAWSNVTVRMTADEKGQQPLAEGIVEQIGGGEVVKVLLRPTAPAVPPAAPAAPVPPAGEKEKAPAAPKPPTGSPAPPALYLHAFDDQKKPFAGSKPVRFEIRISPPRDYITATPQVTPIGGGFTLTVTLARSASASPAFRGKPATARLDVRPALVPGLDPASLKDGTFQTVIAPNAKDVTLVAKNLRFIGRPGPSVVTVAVDGYDRAFVFTTDFSGTTPSLSPSDIRGVRIDTPRYAVPGRPLAARLEVFNDAGDERPRLEFYRAEQGEPEVPTADLTTPRDQAVTYSVGKAGELVLHAAVKDWLIPLDTAGIYGTRTLKFSLTDQAGVVLTRPRTDNPAENEPVSTTHLLTLDDTPPEAVRLLALPPKVVPKKPRKLPPPPGTVPPLPGPSPVPGLVLPPWACDCVLPPRFGVPVPPKPLVVVPKELPPPLPLVIGKTRVRGTPIELVARAEDPESGITGAVLFLGQPPGPDGKSPQGSKSAVGVLAYRPVKGKQEGPPEALGYAATFDLPDVKGPVTIGVRFMNGAGLVTEVTQELLLVDPTPPPTTGTIEGRVVQGSTPERPQPGLDVLLTDPAGKVIKAAKTDAAGAFKFEELLPGPYAVMSVKIADYGAKAIQPATVEAGEVTTVTLELKR
jgi:hypothetical protein